MDGIGRDVRRGRWNHERYRLGRWVHTYRRPLGFWALVVLVWAILVIYTPHYQHLDLVVYGSIVLPCTVAAVMMAHGTPPERWTMRGLGLWGLMIVLALLYFPGLLREIGILDIPPTEYPEAFIQFRRAVSCVSGPFIAVGILRWYRDYRKHRAPEHGTEAL